MKKFISIIMILSIFAGCKNTPQYIEGTETAIGMYIPVDGSLMGVEAIHYLNGCVVRASSNNTFTVEREYSTTNSYFGIIHTIEKAKTKVDVK